MRLIKKDRNFDANSFSNTFDKVASRLFGGRILLSWFFNSNYNINFPHVQKVTNMCHRIEDLFVILVVASSFLRIEFSDDLKDIFTFEAKMSFNR